MSRPYSSAGRPSTASSPPFSDPRYQYPNTPTTASTSTSDVQWAYGSNSRPYTGAGEDLYEEDESEEEDVFAYLPPTTAEQQAAQQQPQSHIQPTSAPLASVQPVTYPNTRPALSSPTPVLQPSTPVHPSASAASAPPESFRMRALKERVPRQNKTPEVHVSLEDPETGHLTRKRSISTDQVMEQLAGPSADDKLPAKHGDGATLSSLHFTSSRRSDFSVEYEPQFEEEDDSPYPEVRASVSNIDDPEMPALTFRVWAIGLTMCMLAAGANTFFNFRYPSPTLAPLIMLLVSYPTGKFLAFALPITDYGIPRWLGGGTFSLNPGPFNIKEHVLIFIMSNVATSPGYGLNVIVVAEEFYKIRLGSAWNLCLMLATQLTGFGLAGICRRYLVWPASMIWPQNLVVCTLLNTLHAEDDEPGRGGGITRFKFYVYVSIAAFVWHFLPGYLFTALSAFSWLCWFRPRDVKINQLFGVYSGLGMGLFTFDWAQISYVGSPMMVPWWAEVHVFIGFVIFYWGLVPILYYNNVWNFGHFPLTTSGPYDRFGKSYNVTRVIDAEKFAFNLTAYEEYSPLYLPSTYATTYLLAFAVSTAVLVHTLLYHGHKLVAGFKNLRVEEDDVHARLMRHYPEVPDWWYMVIIVVFFALSMVTALAWPTGMPWWGMPFSLLIPTIYVVPIAYVYAMTGQALNINLVSEIIPGSLIAGKPLPNMIFKSYAVQSLAEALVFTQDLKLGHYIKAPPRATFLVQVISTFISAFVQVGIKEWMFHNVKGICTDDQPQKLTCPHNRVYFTASAVWGLIGPTRMFGKGAIYNPHLYALLFGALIPIPFWLWQRKFPQSPMRYVNIPVMLNGPLWIPPATGINYSSWFMAGFIFQYIVRRRNFRWWSKFNYTLSAALDSGTLICYLVIFFCIQFPLGDKGDLKWWGNTVHMNTADYQRQPWLSTPPEGFS